MEIQMAPFHIDPKMDLHLICLLRGSEVGLVVSTSENKRASDQVPHVVPNSGAVGDGLVKFRNGVPAVVKASHGASNSSVFQASLFVSKSRAEDDGLVKCGEGFCPVLKGPEVGLSDSISKNKKASVQLSHDVTKPLRTRSIFSCCSTLEVGIEDHGLFKKGLSRHCEKRKKMKIRKSKFKCSRILEEKINEIIVMGTALGFDFKNKVRMVDVIAKAFLKLKGIRHKLATK
ncbi:hypothetical protein LWI29_015587 [Acer saccharum]|uniref:Uncharacterized protein n=1 Tax=Acer saccharum TaxID=4024 RepID=A0AA39VKU0_ACESA|nr:hypothetical protein LWI29_015587 [Acer saccharum]